MFGTPKMLALLGSLLCVTMQLTHTSTSSPQKSAITDAGLRSLAPLTALTSLNVCGCTGITDDVRRRTLGDLLSFIRSSLVS